MSTDKYQSPLSERYASKEMQYIFFSGHEVPHLAEALDCPGGGGEGTGTEYYPGAD